MQNNNASLVFNRNWHIVLLCFLSSVRRGLGGPEYTAQLISTTGPAFSSSYEISINLNITYHVHISMVVLIFPNITLYNIITIKTLYATVFNDKILNYYIIIFVNKQICTSVYNKLEFGPWHCSSTWDAKMPLWLTPHFTTFPYYTAKVLRST